VTETDIFLLRAIYFPNISIRIDDRPTTDPSFKKKSNGDISATRHPIDFMFGTPGRVFWIGGSNGATSGWKVKMAAGHVLLQRRAAYLWHEKAGIRSHFGGI